MMLLATVMAFGAFCATAGYSLLAIREAAIGDEGGDPRAMAKGGRGGAGGISRVDDVRAVGSGRGDGASVGPIAASEATQRRKSHRIGHRLPNERVNVWDHRAARDAAQEVVTAANPPRTLEALCAKGERALSSARRGPSSPGLSQKPLDGRNLATVGLVAPRGALGRIPPDSSCSLPDFQAAHARLGPSQGPSLGLEPVRAP